MAIINYMLLGKLGYEKYKEHTHIETHVGPPGADQAFSKIPIRMQRAWEEAAIAIISEFNKLIAEDE